MTEHLDGWEQMAEVVTERRRQDMKWGEQNHPDGTGEQLWRLAADNARQLTEQNAREGTLTWLDILQEEVCEAFAEGDPEKLYQELIQVEAVCMAWRQAIIRRRQLRLT